MICLGFGAAAQSARASWGQQFPVSPPAGEADADSPNVVADDGGNFTYVWTQQRDGEGSDVLARVSHHDGTLTRLRVSSTRR